MHPRHHMAYHMILNVHGCGPSADPGGPQCPTALVCSSTLGLTLLQWVDVHAFSTKLRRKRLMLLSSFQRIGIRRRKTKLGTQ